MHDVDATTEAHTLRDALNDVLTTWLTCPDPLARRDQLRALLMNESAWPLTDAATSLLHVRAHPTGVEG